MSNLTKWSGKQIFLLVCFALPFYAHSQEFEDGEEWPNHQVYSLTAARGTYLLDFDKIYETVASLDVETVVTLPQGYTFSLNRSGSIDFINAFTMQNRLFFTRTIDHRISTSITCNVITPDGEAKTLVFKIKGGPQEPVVYAIHFVVEKKDVKEEESLAQRCAESVNYATAKKERELNESVHRGTIVEALPAFFGVHRRQAKVEHKGAEAYINGIIFSRGEAYIYVLSNVKRDNCDIVKLLSIKQGKNELMVDLVDMYENINGTWGYVYRAPLQMPSKKTKIEFLFEIWSKELTYKIIMS